jgi:5'(3')-deoxyribonucleotidase
MNCEKPNLFVDLDDTVANFSQALKDLDQEVRARYAKSWHAPGFYRNLKPLEGAVAAIEILKTRFNVFFLSTPPSGNIGACTEKAEWVAEHFGPDMVERLNLCARKSLFSGSGIALVDDREVNGAKDFRGYDGSPAWLRFGGQDFPNWDTVVRRLMDVPGDLQLKPQPPERPEQSVVLVDLDLALMVRDFQSTLDHLLEAKRDVFFVSSPDPATPSSWTRQAQIVTEKFGAGMFDRLVLTMRTDLVSGIIFVPYP